MAGAWDFTATINGSNNFIIALDAILAQDASGNISATGSVTSNGPSGNVFSAALIGSSLPSVTNISVDYLGNACGNKDNGTRSLTGTIDSSNKVNLTFDNGGEAVTITGTLNASATPAFSGTFTVSAPGCNNDGDTGNLTGVMASAQSGNYAGTPVGNSGDNITFSLSGGANNSLSGSGTDTANGPFTLNGTSVGNMFSLTVTPSGGQAFTLLGYYDPQLGSQGSALPAVPVGPGATSCPNGTTLNGESCLFAIFAKQ